MKKLVTAVVLLLSALAIALVVMLVGSGRVENSSETLAGIKFPGTDTYGEAPTLHTRVQAGDLPPVDERLPQTPIVVTPIDAPGGYVDVIKSLQLRNDKYYSTRIVYDASLLSWSADHSNYAGVLADTWKVSDDARTYTFHLRKGLRWSDGKPFTTSDIEFVIKDVIQDSTLGVGFPVPWLSSTAVNFTKADEYSFTLTLDKPDGNLLTRLAGMGGRSLVLYQKEYSGRFHPKYSETAEADARQAGFRSVIEYFYAKCPHFHGNLDAYDGRPTMNAWVVATGKRGDSMVWQYKRNPYYYRIDTKGNQLPYADRIDFYVVQSPEDRMLRAMAGEADIVYPFSPLDRPTLYKSKQRGGYKLIEVEYDGGPHLVIGFNRNGPDEELAALAAEKNFRIATSVAIDRSEICRALFNGKGEPFQAAPLRNTPFYDEAFAKQYTEYSRDQANRLLDDLGLVGRNADNIRLLKSGRPLAYTLVYYPRDTETPNVLEFIQRHWREVGIKLILRSVDETSFMELMSSGKYSISAMTGPNNMYTYNPWAMVPIEMTSSIYASGWHGYFRNKVEGKNVPFVEPDKATKRAIDAYVEMSSTVDEPKKERLIREIIANAKEQFYLVGTFTAPNQIGLKGERMMNVPDSFVLSWQRGGPANVIQPAQWWKK